MNSHLIHTRIQSARQCAPVLARIKPSNLLILEGVGPFEVLELMDGTGLSFEYLYGGKNKQVWLVYWLEELKEILEKWENRLFLRKLGYNSFEDRKVFGQLKYRYETYLCGKSSYPHELGILLGYPLEDVVGFMKNKGKNYLYSGYWKVYKNAENAKRLFERYHAVRKEAEKLALEGKGLWEMIGSFAGPRELPSAI